MTPSLCYDCITMAAVSTWRSVRHASRGVRRYSVVQDIAQRLTGPRGLASHERAAALGWLPDAAQKLRDDQLGGLETPQLAQLLGACAMAKAAPADVFMRSAKVLGTPERLRTLNSKLLVSLSYAYATAGVPARVLLDRLAAQLCPPPAGPGADDGPSPASGCIELSGLGAAQLARLGWSYTHLAQHSPALFEAVARAAQARLGEFGAAELSMLCFALGGSGYAAWPASAALLARAAESLSAPGGLAQWAPSLLCALACGYTRACEPEARGRVLGAIAQRLTPLAQPDRDVVLPRELATLLWAYAVSAEGAEPHAHALVQALAAEVQARGVRAFSAVEVHQVHHALSVLALEAPALRLELPSQFARAPQQQLAQKLQRRPQGPATSALCGALRAVGVAHEREHRVAGTPFVVDVALPDAKLALELRGYHSHLQRRAPDECKARVLGKLGWRVEALGWHHCALLGRAQQLGEIADLIRAGRFDGLGSRARALAAQVGGARRGKGPGDANSESDDDLPSSPPS